VFDPVVIMYTMPLGTCAKAFIDNDNSINRAIDSFRDVSIFPPVC
jgi:hypothetical protein